MAGSTHASLDRFQRKPLARFAAALFAVVAPGAGHAATWIVNSCDQGNSGDLPTKTGTLRFAATNAASGDTVDMTALACGTISLKTGSIHVSQTSLTINGPGRDALLIRGKFEQNTNTYSDKDRIFRHNGTGTLTLSHLTMSDGYLSNSTGYARGGCVYSKGSVHLNDVVIRDCLAKTSSGDARGAGVYTVNSLYAGNSAITSNSATAGSTGNAVGGGVFSNGDLTAMQSTIADNTAKGPVGDKIGVAGGLFVGGDLTLFASTISNNTAGRNAGGIDAFNFSPENYVATIANSTISGNYAAYLVGGVYVNSGQLTIDNTTIAFNRSMARNRQYGSASFAGGVTASARYGSLAIDMHSTLISNNRVKNVDLDLTTPYANPPDVTITFSDTSAKNLVRVSDTAAQELLPADTLTSCPLLGPLRDNGGPTLTHVLHSTSPAIDAGGNIDTWPYDQRGAPYLRESGPVSDIGAYEVQKADSIFDAGFEGCTALP